MGSFETEERLSIFAVPGLPDIPALFGYARRGFVRVTTYAGPGDLFVSCADTIGLDAGGNLVLDRKLRTLRPMERIEVAVELPG